MKNQWNKANAKFISAWDINARRYVRVNKVMKRKARSIARKNLKAFLSKEIQQL